MIPGGRIRRRSTSWISVPPAPRALAPLTDSPAPVAAPVAPRPPRMHRGLSYGAQRVVAAATGLGMLGTAGALAAVLAVMLRGH